MVSLASMAMEWRPPDAATRNFQRAMTGMTNDGRRGERDSQHRLVGAGPLRQRVDGLRDYSDRQHDEGPAYQPHHPALDSLAALLVDHAEPPQHQGGSADLEVAVQPEPGQRHAARHRRRPERQDALKDVVQQRKPEQGLCGSHHAGISGAYRIRRKFTTRAAPPIGFPAKTGTRSIARREAMAIQRRAVVRPCSLYVARLANGTYRSRAPLFLNAAIAGAKCLVAFRRSTATAV